MTNNDIKINDFILFYDIVKSLTRIAEGVKMTVNDCGLTVFAKNDYSKCELTSNAVVSENEMCFCIGDIGMFLKILTTVKDIYDGDYSCVQLSYDRPFIKISSGKFRTKIATVDENRILNFIGTKVHTELTSQLDFTTSSGIIRTINSHSFIFNDSSSARIYLTTEDGMENNVIFATIGNEGNDLANSVTLELGLINSGSLGGRKIILDFNRLNILNIVPSDEIKVTLAKERPVLISKVSRNGKNNTFFNLGVYSFMMVK